LPAAHSNEGLVYHLALCHLLLRRGGDDDGAESSLSSSSSHEEGGGTDASCSVRDRAAARWLAGTMYYQHPAVHPLPHSLLSLEREEDSKQRQQTRPGGTNDGIGGRCRDLSSYILGEGGPELSMHHRVQLPGAGCMGGLGASMPPARPENKLRNNNKADNGGIAVVLGDRDKGGGGAEARAVGGAGPRVHGIVPPATEVTRLAGGIPIGVPIMEVKALGCRGAVSPSSSSSSSRGAKRGVRRRRWSCPRSRTRCRGARSILSRLVRSSCSAGGGCTTTTMMTLILPPAARTMRRQRVRAATAGGAWCP
jgi:hypothetical protein